MTPSRPRPSPRVVLPCSYLLTVTHFSHYAHQARLHPTLIIEFQFNLSPARKSRRSSIRTRILTRKIPIALSFVYLDTGKLPIKTGRHWTIRKVLLWLLAARKTGCLQWYLTLAIARQSLNDPHPAVAARGKLNFYSGRNVKKLTRKYISLLCDGVVNQSIDCPINHPGRRRAVAGCQELL